MKATRSTALEFVEQYLLEHQEPIVLYENRNLLWGQELIPIRSVERIHGAILIRHGGYRNHDWRLLQVHHDLTTATRLFHLKRNSIKKGSLALWFGGKIHLFYSVHSFR